MSNETEFPLVARYAARVLASSDLDEPAYARCLQHMNGAMLPATLDIGEELRKFVEKLPRSHAERYAFRRAFLEKRDAIVGELELSGETSQLACEAEVRATALAQALSLPWASARIIAASMLHDLSQSFSDFCTGLVGSATSHVRLMGALTGINAGEVDFLAGKKGLMTQLGVMRFDGDQYDLAGRYGRYQLPAQVSDALQQPGGSDNDLVERVLGPPLVSSLLPGDFAHVNRHLDMASRILAQASAQRVEGVNILFYGPPGTGKTELAAMVAQAAGVRLFTAGEDGCGFIEQDRSMRLASLVLTAALASRLERSAVLFDEFEDIAADFFKRGGSKVFINRMLERNKTPVIWATNNARRIDPAFIRRMTYVAEIGGMRPRQRRDIFKRITTAGNLTFAPASVEAIASQYDVPVSAMRNAALATKLAAGDEGMLDQAVKDQATALGCRVDRCMTPQVEFNPTLSPASTNLAALTRDLQASGQLDISLCLHGPSGTGKSAYARHLAQELDLPVIEKRSSDLVDCYIGETEKAIRRAFEEALDDKAMLIFDEADSLLFDRQGAQRSWEISQVNEMLVGMERHPLPFCCTTNRIDGIDSAALRRFAFRIEFDYLAGQQLKLAWACYFPEAEYDPSIAIYANLTSGDFAQIRRNLRLRGGTSVCASIAGLLAEASSAKPGGGNRIGFRALV